MHGPTPFTDLRVLTLLALISGCAGAGIRPVSPPPPLPFEELKKSVSRLRELPFQHEVSLETRPKEEVRRLLEQKLSDESDKESVAQLARVYGRLGLIPEDADLAKALTDLRFFRESARYDVPARSVIAPQGSLAPGLVFLRSPWPLEEEKARELVLAHALARALQEQHFQPQDKGRHRNTEDMRLALGALESGDAVLVGLAHLAGGSKELILDGVKGLALQATRADKEMAYLPQPLRGKAVFQYVQGSQFVLWAYSLKGWEGVNRLFSSPPLSTKEILHPEKYFTKRENPVWITPWNLIRRFSGQKKIEETLGEYLIRLLLARTLSREEAERAAAGWTGDTLLAFEQGEQLVLGWITAWENREEALEFYQSYRRALENRRGISLESAGANTLTSRSGPPLLLQVRENIVFFLDGVPAPRSVAIAEGVWGDLEIGTESQPLELGRLHAPAVVK